MCDFMPTNYNTGAKWFRQYIFDDPNIFSLDNQHDTPSVLFPKFIISSLLQNHPNISIDDIGMQVRNRQHYYARWQDFPVPNVVTNQAQVVVADTLTGSAITNVSPQMTNIFNTVEVQLSSVNHTNNLIDTGELRMSDLHDRKFLIFTNSGNTPSCGFGPLRVWQHQSIKFQRRRQFDEYPDFKPLADQWRSVRADRNTPAAQGHQSKRGPGQFVFGSV